MSVAQWNDELKIGVCGVDCQHKAMFKMLNGLYGILEKSHDAAVVSDMADFFADFIVEHFQCEEKIMRDQAYPGYEPHKKEHDDFAAKVAGIVREFNQTGDIASLAGSIKGFVAPWLTDHFAGTDRDMADFITGASRGKVA